MARRRRQENFIEIAIASNWKFSAILAVILMAVVFVWIPAVTNPFLKAFAYALKPIGYVLMVVFGLIALVKFILTSTGKVDPTKAGLAEATARWQKPSYARTSASSYEFGLAKTTTPAKPAEWSLQLIQDIEWKKFEELATAYYQEKGIRAVATPLGADGGIDIKLYQDGLGAPTSIVQCKAWGRKLVGVKPIREFLGVMHHEKISKGFYMTSGGYTEEAKEIAKSNGITLITGEMLLMMVGRLPDESKARLLALSSEGDYMTPTCATCGVKMVKRSSKRGEFWGCRNYPRCKQKLHVRRN